MLRSWETGRCEDCTRAAARPEADCMQPPATPQPCCTHMASRLPLGCRQTTARLQADRNQKAMRLQATKRQTAGSSPRDCSPTAASPPEARSHTAGTRHVPGFGHSGSGNWTRFGCRNPAPKLDPAGGTSVKIMIRGPETGPVFGAGIWHQNGCRIPHPTLAQRRHPPSHKKATLLLHLCDRDIVSEAELAVANTPPFSPPRPSLCRRHT